MHLTADKPNKLSFTAYFTSPQPKVEVKTLPNNQLSFSGTSIDHEGVKGMVRYKGLAAFKTKGGIATQSDTSIIIKNANEVTIYISIATNFNNYHDIRGDENERANSYLNAAVSKPFETIKSEHIKAFQQYFNRVQLNLGKNRLIEKLYVEYLILLISAQFHILISLMVYFQIVLHFEPKRN